MTERSPVGRLLERGGLVYLLIGRYALAHKHHVLNERIHHFVRSCISLLFRESVVRNHNSVTIKSEADALNDDYDFSGPAEG